MLARVGNQTRARPRERAVFIRHLAQRFFKGLAAGNGGDFRPGDLRDLGGDDFKRRTRLALVVPLAGDDNRHGAHVVLVGHFVVYAFFQHLVVVLDYDLRLDFPTGVGLIGDIHHADAAALQSLCGHGDGDLLRQLHAAVIVVGCVVGRVGQDGALRARVRHCVRLRPGECAVAVHRGGKLGLGNALAVGDAAGRRPFNGRGRSLAHREAGGQLGRLVKRRPLDVGDDGVAARGQHRTGDVVVFATRAMIS